MRQKGLRILIIEDTPARQEALTRLCREHAWVLVHTAARAMTLLSAYRFDLIFLDYDLAGPEKGEAVAAFIPQSPNREARVIVHAMNANGAAKIRAILPEAEIVPFSNIVRNNATVKRFKEALRQGADIDWAFVFWGEQTLA